MLKQLNKFFIFIIFNISLIYGEIIIHERIEENPYGVPVIIKAFLDIDESSVFRFSLLYRIQGNIEYIEASMHKVGPSVYEAEIPGQFCKREYLEYYLMLDMKNFSQINYPLIDAESKPIRIAINTFDKNLFLEEKSNAIEKDLEDEDFAIFNLEPEYIILSPKPGEKIYRHNLFIALSYFNILNIDINSINVFLDDMDVTKTADIDSTYLILNAEHLTPGLHFVRVSMTNELEQKFKDITWDFTILPGEMKSNSVIKNQESIIKGNYSRGSSNLSNFNFGEFLFNHDMELDWLSLELKYLKSSLENEFYQPSDRYSIFLNNDFLDIKIGDSYPNISGPAWNGQRVRGFNITFIKDPMMIKYIKGQTYRAVQGDPKNNAMLISSIDQSSDTTEVVINRDNYTFQQEALAYELDLSLKKIEWNLSYIKVEDNILTVSNSIPNAEIVIPAEIENKFSSNRLTYESLLNSFPPDMRLIINTDNWLGKKPQDNSILSSNFNYHIDDSRIIIRSGFSLSLLNKNKWNSFKEINELDALWYDSNKGDGYFLESIQLDNNVLISNIDYISFSQESSPMVPFILKQSNASFTEILNLSNLYRYNKIIFRYLNHRFEAGNYRVGPDYNSILNQSYRKDYKETYFSDHFSMLKQKILIFIKKSNIVRGLYPEIIFPTKIKKTVFNIGLYPGNKLPTFNFGFIELNRDNGVKSYHTLSDTIFKSNNTVGEIIKTIVDNRINLSSKHYNLSMTNHFKLFVPHTLSLNIMLSEQIDNWANISLVDSLILPKNTISETYTLSINSHYDKYWNSNIYLNKSEYDFGQDSVDYTTEGIYTDYKQQLYNYQFQLIQRTFKYLDEIIYGLNYSFGIGTNYYTQYSFNLGLVSKPIENLLFKFSFDYRLKYLGANTKSPDDFMFRTQIIYNIL